VLVVWTFGFEIPKPAFTRGVSMKANTAVSFTVAATALLLLLSRSRVAHHIGHGLGALTMTFGALTLSQHLFGWNLHIDQLFFEEPPGALATVSPGRMGPPASLSFALAGAALLFLDRPTPRGRSPSQWLACTILAIATLPLLGYMTDVRALYGLAEYTGIASYSAATFVALAIGILLARPDMRPATLLLTDDAGGELARSVLPAIVFLPMLLAWAGRMGERLGLYNREFGHTLVLLALIGLFSGVVSLTATRLSGVTRAWNKAVESTVAVSAEAHRLASQNLETLRLLDAVFAHAPIGVAFLDKDLRFVRINDYLAEQHELESHAHVGKPLSEVIKSKSVLNAEALRSVLERGEAISNLETTSGQESSLRWWLTGCFPVRNAAGEVVLVGAIAVDITERKNLDRQRSMLLESERAARTEAERAATLKDEFLATVSHELRTPLNAILGWASITRSKTNDQAQVEKALEVIERNARLQAQLIDDLLDISRIVSGKIRLDTQAIDLSLVVQSAINSVLPAAHAKRIRVQQMLDQDLPVVIGDQGRLQQIVWNLLSNAVKFTDKGGNVRVRTKGLGSQVEIVIEDDGAGISAEFLPHVFERFRQADGSTTRRHGGLGLGLSIVRHLTEMHGGTAAVASSGLGQGSTFTITLPVAGSADARASSPPDDGVKTKSAEAVALDGLHVLIVDDEPDARDVLQRVLSDCGATTASAANADDALRAIEKRKPDAIVSDIGMPGKDGYELIRTIREQFDGKALPAIALTAFARAEDRRRALLSGFQAYIVKPVDPFEISVAIASLSGRSSTAASA
jgi:PAS domain S-box-containing protein